MAQEEAAAQAGLQASDGGVRGVHEDESAAWGRKEIPEDVREGTGERRGA
jgi:hypothetical protein